MAIHALWHAQLLPLALRHRNENVAVMVSRHRDGEIISRAIEGLGYRPVRGSSTRGGAAALRELARAASEGHPLSITTDGPRGPARQCKPGVIQAASITGLPIVPCAAAPVRTWIFRGWDDFLMPKPGTVVYIAYGQPIEIPPQVSREAFPEWQRRVTRALDEATRACTEAAGGTGGSADR
jgi:lysophospholipid acyltransferase (LPLAT)-like uncharacterized protein